jgi:hypothetical protein
LLLGTSCHSRDMVGRPSGFKSDEVELGKDVNHLIFIDRADLVVHELQNFLES